MDDIAQLGLSYADRYMLCGLCYHDYRIALKLSFYHFEDNDGGSNLLSSRYMYAGTRNKFLHSLNAFIANVFTKTTSNHTNKGDFYGHRTPVTLYLCSNPDDHIYDGEYGIEPLEDACKFQQHFMSVLSNCKQMHSNGMFSPTKNQPVFLSPKEMMHEDIHVKLGQDTTGVLPGVKEFYEELSNFSLVDDMGQVTIPRKWVPLAPNEDIVAAVGQYLHPHFLEVLWAMVSLQWVWGKWALWGERGSLIGSLLYHRKTVIGRGRERHAFILTTHRVIEIILRQRKGKVPPELGSMDICVTSYFPKNALSGYMYSSDGYRIQSALLTSHGSLSLTVPSNHLVFAQRLQMTTSRKFPIGNKQNIDSLLPDLDFLQGPRNASSPYYPMNPGNENAEKDEEMPFFQNQDFLAVDKMLLPLMPKEEYLHRFNGGLHYHPCCILPYSHFIVNTLPYLCTFLQNTPSLDRQYCCTTSNWVKWLTCWARPLVAGGSMVLTNHTFFYTSFKSRSKCENPALHPYSDHIHDPSKLENEASKNPALGKMVVHSCSRCLCDCCFYDNYLNTANSNINSHKRGCFQCCGAKSRYQLEPFLVAWVPVHSITNQDVHIRNTGYDPIYPSPALQDYLGGNEQGGAKTLPPPTCCEIRPYNSLSSYVYTINTSTGMSFPLADHVQYRSWTTDRRLSMWQDVIGAVQHQQVNVDLDQV